MKQPGTNMLYRRFAKELSNPSPRGWNAPSQPLSLIEIGALRQPARADFCVFPEQLSSATIIDASSEL
jgi:hypothetical protein